VGRNEHLRDVLSSEFAESRREPVDGFNAQRGPPLQRG
jgi:hypothetical protein